MKIYSFSAFFASASDAKIEMLSILDSTKTEAQNEEDKQNILTLMDEYKIYKRNYAKNIKFDPTSEYLSK